MDFACTPAFIKGEQHTYFLVDLVRTVGWHFILSPSCNLLLAYVRVLS
jgi:hypothetical protein